MDLVRYLGKRVRIVSVDDHTFIGKINDYCYPEDNESGKESIIIDCEMRKLPIEFEESEIRSIEIL